MNILQSVTSSRIWSRKKRIINHANAARKYGVMNVDYNLLIEVRRAKGLYIRRDRVQHVK